MLHRTLVASAAAGSASWRCGCVGSRRGFFNTYLSSRITNRERDSEQERRRIENERMLTAMKLSETSALAKGRTLQSLDSAELAASRAKLQQQFHDAIFLYLQRYGRTRRGHAEFIESAVRRMADHHVADDLEAYRALMQLFPKERMRSRSVWQSEFKHYPKQQDAALYLMDAMLDNKVMPDTKFGHLILEIFGSESYPMSKFQRMMYWMPKLRHADPWPEAELTAASGLRYAPKPNSARQMAAALRRMCPDPLAEVVTYDLDGEVEGEQEEEELDSESGDSRPFVASAQAPDQLRLLQQLQPGRHTVFLDGPFTMWLHKHQLSYYVLCSDPAAHAQQLGRPPGASASSSESSPDEEDPRTAEDFSWWRSVTFPYDDEASEAAAEDKADKLAPLPTVHEQSDMTVLALAVPSRDSRQLLLRWLRLLASGSDCQHLNSFNIVFRQRLPDEVLGSEPAAA